MVDRIRRLLGGRAALIGVIGALLLLAGTGLYQALITPPYRFIDEQAHAGYVLAIQRGQLPTIDSPIDQDAGGTALRTRLESEPLPRHDVWVANNPPAAYVVAAAPAALTRALGLPGGPLLGLRLANLAGALGAVALTYLLARDLADGNRTVGLVAAGLAAAMPHLGFVSAIGFTDGLSLLATTGVLVWLARVCGAGPGGWGDRRSVQLLGLWLAVAASARPMAMVLALAAGVVAIGVIWWRRSTPPLWSLAWLALPPTLAAGWFYALNVHRYGDPTGSSALFDKFGRQSTSTLWDSLSLRGAWESAFRTITTRRLEVPLPGDPYGWYRIALAVTLVGIVGTVVLLVRSAVQHRGSRAGGLPGVAWAATAAVSLVPVVLTAQHRAGGGAPHARYLLPMVPVVVTAVALALVRFTTRWGAMVVVIALSAVMVAQTRAASRWLAANPKGPAGSQLVAATGSELVRGATLAAAAIGLVALLVAIASDPERA